MKPAPVTERYNVAASAYVHAAARRRLWSVVWVPALIVAALAVAGCFDSRYWFLALLFVFIIYPMAVSFMWLMLSGRPSMRWLLRPQQCAFGPDGITVEFFGYDDPDAPAVASWTIAPADIRNIEQGGKYITVYPSANGYGIAFLLIPAKSMPPGVNLYELLRD